MKAVRFHEYGDPDVLRYEDVDDPTPGTGQVRVRVAATTFNGVDGNIRAGFMQGPMPLTLPHVPGLDVAGTVDALGAGVEAFAVGEVGHPLAAGRGVQPEAGQQLELHVAQVAGVAQLLIDRVPEQTHHLDQGEVRPELDGVERRR